MDTLGNPLTEPLGTEAPAAGTLIGVVDGTAEPGRPDSIIKPDQYGTLGQYVDERFTIFRSGKQTIEQEWMDNLRAYKGEYTPEQIARMSKVSPTGSQVFINITRAEVGKAKTLILQVMALEEGFPFQLEPSADPEIDGIDTSMLRELLNEAANMIPEGPERDAFLAQNDLEGAVKRFKDEARKRCNGMELEVKDNLQDMKFDESFVRSLDHLTIYGTAIFMGPVSKSKRPTRWAKDANGKWSVALKDASEQDLPSKRFRPDVTLLDPFTVYIDPLCTRTEDMTEVIVRKVLTPYQLSELRKDPSYSAEAINSLLEDEKGNWVAETWETVVETDASLADKSYQRYMLLDYWGYLSGSLLKQNGVKIPEGTENQFLLVNLVVSGGQVLRAVVSNRNPAVMPFHVVPYEIVPGRIHGRGVPKQIEDSQQIFNATERAKIDNMAFSVGPMGYYDAGRIGADFDPAKLHPLKMYPVDSMDGLSQAPVQFFQPRSNVNEMNAMQEAVKWHLQKETSIPDFAMGIPGSPAHNRTAEGLSMQQSQAIAWVRTVIGNLDLFLVNPVIRALVDWNMQFNPDDSIKGDFDVVAKGVQGAMSREVMSLRLGNFLNIFQSPELKHLVDWEVAGDLLEKASGVKGMGLILPYMEAMKRKQAEEESSANAQAQSQRMQPVIPPQNAALEILSKTPETSPLFGPAYQAAVQANGLMNPAFAAGIDITNEVAAAQARNLISGQDNAALTEDVTPPMAPDPAQAGPGAPPQPDPAAAPAPAMPMMPPININLPARAPGKFRLTRMPDGSLMAEPGSDE